MKILVTGAKGFVGKNLCMQLNNIKDRKARCYGKWCCPNYNSAIATFCNNIANELPITEGDPSVELEVLYRLAA